MKKKLLFIILVVTTLLVAACSGSGDKKSEKEAVTQAFESLMNLESYESTFSLGLNVSGDNVPAEVQPYLDAINDATFSMDMVYDEAQQKQEATINLKAAVSPLTFDLSVPFHFDMENLVAYIGVDSILDNFGMMFGLPEDLRGKYLEIDLNAIDPTAGEVLAEDAELQKQVQEVLLSFIENKDDADFSKDGDVYTVKFTQDDFKTLITDVMAEFDETFDEAAQAQFEEEFDAAFEMLEIKTFEIKTTIKDDKVTAQSFVIDLTVNDPATGNVNLGLKVDTTYDKINEDVEFKIDPASVDVIPFEEIMGSMMMGMY